MKDIVLNMLRYNEELNLASKRLPVEMEKLTLQRILSGMINDTIDELIREGEILITGHTIRKSELLKLKEK